MQVPMDLIKPALSRTSKTSAAKNLAAGPSEAEPEPEPAAKEHVTEIASLAPKVRQPVGRAACCRATGRVVLIVLRWC